MKNKIIKTLSALSVCTFATFVYIQTNNTSNIPVVTKESTYVEVVMKDEFNTLIPIEIEVEQTTEVEQTVRQSIEVMKSNDFIDFGLYPLLPENLVVNGMTIDQNNIIIDVNESFEAHNNQEALDLAEGLSYILSNLGMNTIDITINGEQVDMIPNSSIPISAISPELGINNFETDTNDIFKTVPVIVYNARQVDNKTMYVPSTIRVQCSEDDYTSRVSKLLENIDYPKDILLEGDVVYTNSVLDVHLQSNILLGNEMIDDALFQQLTKSLMAFPEVTKVNIYIDGQLHDDSTNVSNVIANRIKY